jgi:hypothetical protein
MAESLLALRANFDRNLVGRTADAARTHFNSRTDVVERTVEHGDRILLQLLLHQVEGTIDDRLRTDFLPSSMSEFMNLETTRSPNLGSGLTSRFSAA